MNIHAKMTRAGDHARPVIVMEMNELCPPLLKRWMGDGSLPHFKAMYDRSAVFETEADAEAPNELEPWIQWYSVHTGLAFSQHGVFNLTDGKRAPHRDVFHELIDAGRRVINFSSMNSKPFVADGNVFLADPWSEDDDASPAELNVYNRFVAHNVREYSNREAGLSASDYAAFLSFMARRGLSLATIADIVGQLAAERLRGRHLSYRRVAIQDRLQFDVFRHYYTAKRPDFATFFLNSTAHLQHSYWRHMNPGAFALRPGEDELTKYGDAIKFGYMAMDELVGRFRALAERHDALLVFQTALSQQPFLKREDRGGQHFYRLRKPKEFFAALGIAVREIEPTMTHQYMLSFNDAGARDQARERLSQLRTAGGVPVFGSRNVATGAALYTGCQVHETVPPDFGYRDAASGDEVRFGDHFYLIEAVKSGSHNPIGCLWFETGLHEEHPDRVSILDTYPTLLDLFGVEGDRAGRKGRSLAPCLVRSAQSAAA